MSLNKQRRKMKKDKQTSKYISIINKTKSCIVINSLKIVLKPNGESGDSVIVGKDILMDNDIAGLVDSNLITISPPKVKKAKAKKEDVLVSEKNKKTSTNDKK